ncbi:hypothetical protein EAF04_009420 [Stromatinia cepivora]|nr:hypothetical protein EAF04_009420 [Stromatinia cepivora]
MLYSRTTPLGLAISLLVCVNNIGASQFHIGGVHTGVDAQTGVRPVRKDILDLQKDLPTWSLYIRALISLQNVPEDDPLSWFQIAGIHGRPYYSWGNVSWNPAAPQTGYCTHDDVLFPTWHRPYLALYEQVLANWATVPALPPVVSDATTQIATPSGTQNVANPLLLDKFQQFPLNGTWFPTTGTSTADEDLAQDPTTLRFPNAAVRGASQSSIVGEDLGAVGLMSMIYSMFSKSTAFYNMATQVSTGPSLENPHGAVHVAIGGPYGDMSQLSYSAFDPIFWLHHANVDRLFAMWQAIYTDAWMLLTSDQIGTFTIARGTRDTSASPLTPFYQPDGETPWTSDAARYTNTPGYSYSSVPDAIITNATELSANVTATVNAALYNPEGELSSSKRKSDEKREWSVAIQVLATALGQRFTVRLYTEAGPVASFCVLPPPVADGKIPPSLTYHNEFTLADAMKTVDTSKIEDVVDYLKTNLSWTVEKRDGTVVPTEQVSGLIITVQDEIVTHPADDTQLPRKL